MAGDALIHVRYMKYIIVTICVLVALLGVICIGLSGADGQRLPVNVAPKELALMDFCVNEEYTKASLSFCLHDEAEQTVWAKIEQADDGDVYITLSREAPGAESQGVWKPMGKSAIPGLMASALQDGKEVYEPIIGFHEVFDLKAVPVRQVFIGGEEGVSMTSRRLISHNAGRYKGTISRPIVFH